jgi:hypothetical protein
VSVLQRLHQLLSSASSAALLDQCNAMSARSLSTFATADLEMVAVRSETSITATRQRETVTPHLAMYGVDRHVVSPRVRSVSGVEWPERELVRSLYQITSKQISVTCRGGL